MGRLLSVTYSGAQRRSKIAPKGRKGDAIRPADVRITGSLLCKTHRGAWLLVAFLVPVTLTMHAFWILHNPAAIHAQQAMFAKNLSMLGAALLITRFGLALQAILESWIDEFYCYFEAQGFTRIKIKLTPY
jgi:hypothetical protein